MEPITPGVAERTDGIKTPELRTPTIVVKCMKVVNLCKCCKFTDVTNVREIQDLAH